MEGNEGIRTFEKPLLLACKISKHFNNCIKLPIYLSKGSRHEDGMGQGLKNIK